MNIKEKILELLSEEYNKFLSIDDIISLIDDANLDDINNALNELVDEYKIYLSKKKKYGLLKSFNYYIGKIILKKQGYGFFKSDDLEEDAFIPASSLDNALDNDTCLCYVEPNALSNEHKREGKVIKVLKHNNDLICKVIYKTFNFENKK